MQLSSDWDKLERHVVTVLGRRPPKPVYLAVAALVDPPDIKGSWTTWESDDKGPDDSRTRWTCWVATSAALACAELEFNTALYDEDAEAELGDSPLQATVKQAWRRPLSDVVEIQIGRLIGATRESFRIDAVRLRFPDGEVELPGQGTLTDEKRFDEFLTAINTSLPF
jgi:hypothetical protein